MKIVVTGGAGFIGSHLADFLIDREHEVIIIDNLSNSTTEHINQKAIFLKEDIRNPNLDFTGVDYVFHLASIPSVEGSKTELMEFNDVNVNGTLNLLRLSRDYKVKRFIFSSSSAVYGIPERKMVFSCVEDDTKGGRFLDESSDKNPCSPYALQKLVGEEYGLQTVCLRYFNVYGKRMKKMGLYSFVIPIFIYQRQNGLPLTIRGTGENVRDYVNVFDVVNANLLSMTSDRIGEGEPINIGTGIGISVNQIANIIGGEKIYVDPVLEPARLVALNKTAQWKLGWTPSVDFENWIDNYLNEIGIL